MTGARSNQFTPNENMFYCPERTLSQVTWVFYFQLFMQLFVLQVIAHIDYFPVYLAGLITAAERDVAQLAAMPEADTENPMYSSLTSP